MNNLNTLLTVPTLTAEQQVAFDKLTKGLYQDALHAKALKNFFLASQSFERTRDWLVGFDLVHMPKNIGFTHWYYDGEKVPENRVFAASYFTSEIAEAPKNIGKLHDFADTFLSILPQLKPKGNEMTIKIAEVYTLHLIENGFIAVNMSAGSMSRKRMPTANMKPKHMTLVFHDAKKHQVNLTILLE